MSKIGNYRWKIVALLFFATTINYIDRQIIGILKPFISDDLAWSEADYGFIVTAFQMTYAIGLLITGRFLDKFGTRIGYLVAVLVWSIAGMAHALAQSVSSFALARGTLGLGESANFPAAVKSVTEWFPQKERAFAIGLFNSGSTVGAIVAPVIVSGITLTLGWRWAFILTGALGFLWIIFWLTLYHSPSNHPKLTSIELDYINQDIISPSNDLNMSWSELLKYKQTYIISTTRFISDWVWWFFLFWIPDFLSKSHGINLKEVVLPIILIYAVSSLGGIGGGWLSSQFIKSGRSVNFARKNTILICATLALPLVFVSQTNSLWLAVFLIAIAAAAHQGWASNMFAIISDIYPPKAVGSMTGLCGFAGAVGGALSASFVGLLLQNSGSYFLIFLVASSVYMINWLIIVLFIKTINPITFGLKQ